jgi:hypothetical protein
METLIFIGKAVIGAMVVICGATFYMLCRHSGAMSDAEDCQGYCGGCRAYNVCHKEIKVVI